VWAGVDVGGRRKGFHLAIVDTRRLRAGPVRKQTVRQAVGWLLWQAPRLVAVDSPRAPAPPGCRSRPEEREIARSVCGIRYTPAHESLAGNPRYYDWIFRGLDLYRALAEAGLEAVECFPTASFTRWAGPRGTSTRAAWTRSALDLLSLPGVPPRPNQDGRDAIAAALTARAHGLGSAESFGGIVVPL
jgi:predicted nuclease with RNAse H fold